MTIAQSGAKVGASASNSRTVTPLARSRSTPDGWPAATGALTTAYPPASLPDPDAVVEIPMVSEPGYAGSGARSGRSGTWRVPGAADRLAVRRRTVPADSRPEVLCCAALGVPDLTTLPGAAGPITGAGTAARRPV